MGLLRSWLPESLSIALSGLSLLGLVILLAAYDGKPGFFFLAWGELERHCFRRIYCE